MFIAIISIDIFSTDTIVKVSEEVNAHCSLTARKQGFRTGVPVNLSGMGQYRPFSGRPKKNIIAEPADKW